MKRLFNGGGAAIVVKAATGFAVAAIAMVAAAAVSEAAITGSADPTNWGRAVTQQVATCKAALKTGEHGIGQCVSAFASQHGQVMSGRASGARLNHGNGNANANANANGHAKANGGSNGNANGKGNGNGHAQNGHKPVVASDSAGN